MSQRTTIYDITEYAHPNREGQGEYSVDASTLRMPAGRWPIYLNVRVADMDYLLIREARIQMGDGRFGGFQYEPEFSNDDIKVLHLYTDDTGASE